MAEPRLSELLQRLTPHGVGLDRDLLLFEAGKQAAQPSRFWPTATSLLALSQAILLAALLWPRGPRDAEPIPLAVVPVEAPEAGTLVADLVHWLATEDLPGPTSRVLQAPDSPLRAAEGRHWADE
ncbi:MAG TPA: hypothetical protein PKD86_12060 [Gemmatales bacterium]|nr:hypothetical protein [Gemmatales bacterium]HMP60077.1 hypothetical protein [Gemmatales bacterium]